MIGAGIDTEVIRSAIDRRVGDIRRWIVVQIGLRDRIQQVGRYLIIEKR